MRTPRRTAIAVSSAVLALGTGTGIAAAAGGFGHGPGAGGPPGAQAIATYLGISADELRSDLSSGKSLADVAKAEGKTVAGLEAAMLADLKSHLDDLVNRTGPPAGRGPGGPDGAHAIASYLGLTAAELRTQLGSGKSLADVAKAQEKTVSGLEAALLADVSSHLDDIVNSSEPPATHG